jgi:hypothetical protein
MSHVDFDPALSPTEKRTVAREVGSVAIDAYDTGYVDAVDMDERRAVTALIRIAPKETER